MTSLAYQVLANLITTKSLKKSRLKIEYDYDFFLLGIVTSAKEYKLAWSLNKALGINLVKNEDIVIPKMDANALIISNLIYETENSSVRLIGNRSVGEPEDIKSSLLPELQNFTHFLVLQDHADSFNRDELTKTLKTVSIVDYVVAIAADKLKNKDNLIF